MNYLRSMGWTNHWLAWAIVGFGLFMIVIVFVLGQPRLALERLDLARTSPTWPSTTATTMALWVDTEVGSRTGSSSVDHTVMARYEYQVAGESYVGEQVRFADMTLTNRAGKAIAQNIAERLRAQNPQRVYYNPEEPGQAVLEPGVYRQNIWEFINLVLWSLFGLGIIGFGLWLMSPQANPQNSPTTEQT